MDFGALLLGLMALITAILDERRARAPRRQQEKLEADFARGLAAFDRALFEEDHETLSKLFELERRAALRRGAVLRLRGGPDDHPRGSNDPGAA